MSDPPRPPSNQSHSQIYQQPEHSQKEYGSSNFEPILLERNFKREQHVPENIPSQTDTDFFGLFSCCTNPKVEPDLYVPPEVYQSRAEESRKQEEPYMS